VSEAIASGENTSFHQSVVAMIQKIVATALPSAPNVALAEVGPFMAFPLLKPLAGARTLSDAHIAVAQEGLWPLM
jgi:hypothetical protein